MSDSFASTEKIAAQAAAYDAAKRIVFKPTSVIEYKSKGHVAIIGNAHSMSLVGKIRSPLTSEAILLETLKKDEPMSINGALGNFEIQTGQQVYKADMVLDISPQPVLRMALKPPGYLTANDGDNFEGIKEELGALIGVFDKPRYFDYDTSLCAHGRSGNQGCTRCIDACPAQAISSLGELIEVNAYRCHGGGICATVCPSGAITYAYPTPGDLSEHVRALILAYTKAGAGAPGIAFVSEEQQQRVQQAMPGALVICVEEVASVGPEIWLAALAWGARNVLLFDLDGMPKSARQALDLHIEMVATILQAMQYPRAAVSVLSDLNDLISTGVMPEIETATNAALDQKRQAFYMALDHLVEQAENVKPMVSLPAGSIFGEATVHPDSCTLCMSCVSACPGNALQAGGENPQLGFVEANCLQCGTCTSTCPEDAITITPRLLLDRTARATPRILYAESPFHCISCGKAFATSSGITTILSKLAFHPMFTDDRALSRLKMCSDCRVKDMMEDPNSDL
jgi:ferredoxin